MNIFKKKTNISAFIIVIFFIAFLIVLWTVRGDLLFVGYNKYFIAPSCNKTDKFLKTNLNELSYVAGKLSEMDYESITIRNKSIGGEDGYSMNVRSDNLAYESIPVPDNLINHIETLYENGIQDISFGCNSVNFTMWSTMDESRGIIYSYAGTKPDGEQLIEVSQLSEDNWYYYVHNYEKAKDRNPERFK